MTTKARSIGSYDSEPGNGVYPTTGWRKGEYLTDGHAIDGANPGGGDLRIVVGFYDPATGQRLLTSEGQDQVVLPLK